MISQKTVKREGAFLSVGILLAALWALFMMSTDILSSAEVKVLPVLGDTTIDSVHYRAFEQEDVFCDGASAIANGYLSKVPRLFPPQAKWQRIEIFLGTPDGRRSHDIYRDGDFFDAPQNLASTDRPAGVSDWLWRIRDGCNTSYNDWFAIAYHLPWHGRYEIKTVLGPSPLPGGRD